jgi:hypothetical protein
MKYSVHFSGDLFKYSPWADEVEIIYNGFLLWDSKIK